MAEYEQMLRDSTHTVLVPVLPTWYQKALLGLMCLYLLAAPITAYYIYQSWPSRATIEFNRYIFCRQEQVNSKILSPECVVILDTQTSQNR